jgi:hypothetical protein
LNLPCSNAANIHILWIAEEKVVPKDEAGRFDYPKHFESDLTLKIRLQDGSKDRELSNQVERLRGQRESCCAATEQVNALGAQSSRLTNPVSKQVHPDYVVGMGAPFHELLQPVTCPTPDLEDAFSAEGRYAIGRQEAQESSLDPLHDEDVGRG